MDLKVMPRSHKGHKYILCIMNEVTNHLIMVPIFQARLEGLYNTLLPINPLSDIAIIML